MTEVLTSGTFWGGFIGLVGVLSGLVAPMLHEGRRTDAEWKRVRRLVLAELDQLAMTLEWLSERDENWPPPEGSEETLLPVTSWSAHKHVLADSDRLPVGAWKQVTRAYGLVHVMRAASALPEEDVEKESREAALAEVQAASATLSAVRLPPWWRRVRKRRLALLW